MSTAIKEEQQSTVDADTNQRQSETPSSYDLQEATVEMYTFNNDDGCKKMVPLPPRKRGRPARNSDYEWDEEETFRLIELWSKEELLYNTSDVFYLHRDFRSQAMTNIYKALIQDGIDLRSPVEVRNKMNNLRNYFAAEKRKERRNTHSSAPYKSSWKFYKSLYFLEDNYRPRHSMDDEATMGMDDEGIPSMVQRSSTSSHTDPTYDDEKVEKYSKKHRKEQTPANSYMTVFRKARRNSKVMYSMNQSDNTIVETRPVVRNSTKSFIMNRSKNTPRQESAGEQSPPSLPPQITPQHNGMRHSKSFDEHYREQDDKLRHVKRAVDSELLVIETKPEQQPSAALGGNLDTNAQNLDKCYTDLIYQILVTMPDTVEKAMLKLDFQQKLIKLKYSQKD